MDNKANTYCRRCGNLEDEIKDLNKALTTLGTNLENYAPQLQNTDQRAMIDYYAQQAFNAL